MIIIDDEADGLNNYIFITQPYGKCKISSYTSVRHMAYKILFIIGRSTDMSHVEGVDDGVGYGVYGHSNSWQWREWPQPQDMAWSGCSDSGIGYVASAQRHWRTWRQRHRHCRVWLQRATTMVYVASATTGLACMPTANTAVACMPSATASTTMLWLPGATKANLRT